MVNHCGSLKDKTGRRSSCSKSKVGFHQEPSISRPYTLILTYCRFASRFLVCDTSAAFSIYDVNPLQHFLSCASSVSRPGLYLSAVWGKGFESVRDLCCTLLARLSLVVLAVCYHKYFYGGVLTILFPSVLVLVTTGFAA